MNQFLTEGTPRLAIIAAFGQEADLLIKTTQQKQEYLINGKRFVVGVLENKPVVITLSGISMVNAAMTTQLIHDHFNVHGIVFSGIAGSLNPKLHIGDVVVAKSWFAPNEVYFNNTEQLPVACGQPGDISCLGIKLSKDTPAWGNQFVRETNVINSKNYKDVALSSQFGDIPVAMAYGEMRLDFPVSPDMLKTVNQIVKSTVLELEAICNDVDCYQPKIILGQRGASSGAFLANAAYRDYLHNNFAADCVDMETAAVAQVAYANNIPFIAFRSLSDLAGADHNPNVAAFFSSGIAQRNAAKVTIAFIKAWHE